MKKITLAIFLASYFPTKAQEFKEGIIFDLHGPVKEVLLDKDIYGIRGMGFSKDGKCNPSAMRFDPNGYPLGLSVGVKSDLNAQDSTTVSFAVNYDDQWRVVSTVFNCPVLVDNSKETRTYSYGSTPETMYQVKTMTVLSSSENEESQTEYVFSDYQYDDHGNWISRNVEETIVQACSLENKSKRKYVETRTIAYYD